MGFIFFVQTFYFCHLILGWNMEYEIYEPSVRTYSSLLDLNTILSMAPTLSLSLSLASGALQHLKQQSIVF